MQEGEGWVMARVRITMTMAMLRTAREIGCNGGGDGEGDIEDDRLEERELFQSKLVWQRVGETVWEI